jgi:hypothetical protein
LADEGEIGNIGADHRSCHEAVLFVEIERLDCWQDNQQDGVEDIDPK